ncbi:MAG: hypothetical protein JWM28_2384 [Chitinophagaceae bacterium]|nr:hypothetical protein [Chitinophagaceae bacterium]
MKTNSIRIIMIRSLLLVLLSLYFIVVFGQSSSLVSFNASKKAENIALQWILAPSNNLSTVIIERKTTDTTFQSIAVFWVNFDGNTERNFTYTDKKVKSKTARYRLKCITADGNVQYSSIVLAGDLASGKTMAKPSGPKVQSDNQSEKSLFAGNTVTLSENVEHLKYLLLVQLQERENNLL